jgi:hypothetical protein
VSAVFSHSGLEDGVALVNYSHWALGLMHENCRTAELQEKRERWKHSPPLYGTCMVADVQKHRFGRTSAQVLGTKATTVSLGGC